jgi:uncharacterized membrane protein YecN with MAPEG domain
MVTSLYAGLLGFIYIGLTFFTIKGRFKHGVALGNGGYSDMEKRIRIHANFAEYVPIAIILIFLAEMGNLSAVLIHVLGCGLIIGRVLHAFGLLAEQTVNKKRQIGMIFTLTVIAVASIASIWAYF